MRRETPQHLFKIIFSEPSDDRPSISSETPLPVPTITITIITIHSDTIVDVHRDTNEVGAKARTAEAVRTTEATTTFIFLLVWWCYTTQRNATHRWDARHHKNTHTHTHTHNKPGCSADRPCERARLAVCRVRRKDLGSRTRSGHVFHKSESAAKELHDVTFGGVTWTTNKRHIFRSA